ncbi:MAG: class I SAM-dependent methyltransferase [Deferribacteres bacterium]|nr:class I SAM-dependent methyltransferase [candidate division KSB1 bacterium]MCB9500386.1 class I SAM-dependent methyltransferase [Deferribacteres bacterium]
MLNTWDERYNTKEYIYGTEPNQFVAQNIQNIKKGSVLCLGAGEGRNAVYLAEMGHHVTAVDSSRVGLEKARNLAVSRGVQITTIVADLADFIIQPESWDMITSIFCHLPLQLRKKVNTDVVSGLKPGGIFLLQAYTPEQLNYRTGGPSRLDMLYTLHDLRDELNGLIFQSGEERVREIAEGIMHTGKSAIVELIAVKP